MVRFPGLRLAGYESDEWMLKKLFKNAPIVNGRPTPPNSDVAIRLSSKFGIGFAVTFNPWIRGRRGNWFPANSPKKKSPFTAPSQCSSQGSLVDSNALARNI